MNKYILDLIRSLKERILSLENKERSLNERILSLENKEQSLKGRILSLENKEGMRKFYARKEMMSPEDLCELESLILNILAYKKTVLSEHIYKILYLIQCKKRRREKLYYGKIESKIYTREMVEFALIDLRKRGVLKCYGRLNYWTIFDRNEFEAITNPQKYR
jgi:hypothetical protein